MQCFICVTYMIILCAAQPAQEREAAPRHEKRSLFRDVIESLRIRAQLPEEINHTDDNDLSQSYDRYGFDNEPPELPSDANFIPRRNDRIEMPTLKYRFPKSLHANSSEASLENKEEDIIVYVNTPTESSEPKSTHDPKPVQNPNNDVNNIKVTDIATNLKTDITKDSSRPIINQMEDLSQIGNKEYKTIIKPTVIVNFRGTVGHGGGQARLEKRNNPKRKQEYDSARNIFNINQEIKLERPNGTSDRDEARHMRHQVKQWVEVLSTKLSEKDDNMTVCETSVLPAEEVEDSDGAERSARTDENILQIILTV